MISNTITKTVADHIKELEKLETTAMLNCDYDALNKIWHPEFTVNMPLNRVLKTPDIQGAMKAGIIKYSSLERNIEATLVHDQVVVTLGHEVVVPIEGAPMSGQTITRRFTNIWVQKNNTWRMFSRHASNICEEDK